MSEEINVDEVISTIQFSEIAQKGYKVMSNDEFDRIVNGVLNLQQENQQLKNDNAVMKAGLIQVSDKQRDLYKSVIDDVREYIEETISYKEILARDNWEYRVKTMLEILDKVKEVK